MISKRYFILFLVVIFGVFTNPVTQSVGASQLLQDNGTMDFDGYCRSLGYNGARIDPTQYNVNSWGCLRSDGTQAGMDLFDLCSWQYGGSLPNPEYSDYNDPYSWFCSSTDLGSPIQHSQEHPESHDDYPGADGNCGNALYPGVDENGDPCRVIDGLYLWSEPDVNSPVIGLLPPESHMLLGTEVCNQGYRWYEVQTSIGNGWESESGNTSCILPVEDIQSNQIAQEFDQPLAGDGWDLGVDISSSPFAVYASSAQDYFTEGQCTWFVAGRRPDIQQWIGSRPRHAYLWSERARENGAEVGVYVGSSPEIGDIAVWQADCDGTSPIPQDGACTIGTSGDYEGCGHVAYVTSVSGDGRMFRVDEANWNRQDPDIVVDNNCMSFIHLPVVNTPPIDQPSTTSSPNILEQFWTWIKSLFGF